MSLPRPKRAEVVAKIVERMDTSLQMVDWNNKGYIYTNQTGGPSEKQLLCGVANENHKQVNIPSIKFNQMLFHLEYMDLAGGFRIPPDFKVKNIWSDPIADVFRPTFMQLLPLLYPFHWFLRCQNRPHQGSTRPNHHPERIQPTYAEKHKESNQTATNTHLDNHFSVISCL